MTVTRGFVIIFASALMCAVGGGLTGYSLAVLAPSYYRAVISNGREPWFDPVSVGVGLGISQGLICGLLVGAVVVFAVAWYNSRRPGEDLQYLPSDVPHRSTEA